MKQIELLGKNGIGKFTQVDDEDYDFLMKFKWYLAWSKNNDLKYAMCSLKLYTGKWIMVRMHRFLLRTTDPKILIDHKDRNGLNNQKSNLRIATYSQNSSNKISKKTGTSKYLGVCWHKRNKRWAASIGTGNSTIYLGLFKNEVAAAKRYNEAAIKHHGEFANLNVI